MQFVEHFGVEAREREQYIGKLQGVGQSSDTVDLLDQQEFALDRRLVHFLRDPENVLDDLEHVGIGGQREYQHDQAANPRGHDELVFRMVLVVDEVAEEHGLPLLAQAEHDVQLGARLVGQDRAQELDVARGHFHVDHEIGPRQREEQADPPGVEQDGVEKELALAVVQHRNRKRILGGAVDRLADHVGSLVAVEGRAEHLDLEIDFAARHFAQVAEDGPVNVVDIAAEIGEGPLPAEVEQDLAHRAAQAVVLVRVIAAIGWVAVGFQILGRDGRADEDEIVVEIGPVQDLGGHRVEKGFGQFRLLVVEQQADVEQLDLLPGRILDFFDGEFTVQAFDALIDPVVVEADALAHRLLAALPVGLLEAVAGLAAALAKQRVMLVEALNQRQRDLVCVVAAVKADRNFHASPCGSDKS